MIIDQAMANADPGTVALKDPEIALQRVRGGVSEHEAEALERRAREALRWIEHEKRLLATGGMVVSPQSSLEATRERQERHGAA